MVAKDSSHRLFLYLFGLVLWMGTVMVMVSFIVVVGIMTRPFPPQIQGAILRRIEINADIF